MKISVLIMAQNSEATIERTLESVSNFDEVIVVDGGSKDQTKAIAKKYGAIVWERTFDTFSGQRNFLLSKASNDYCLFVDSDEYVTEELQHALYKKLADGFNGPLIAIMRTEYLDGVVIDDGFGGSSYQDRFMNRHHVKYEGAIHEYPLIDGVRHHHDSPLRVHLAKEIRLLHLPSYSAKDALKKLGTYSIVKAEEKYRKGRTSGKFLIIISFIGTLFKVWAKNLKHSDRGFILATLEALHRCMIRTIIFEEEMMAREKKSASKKN